MTDNAMLNRTNRLLPKSIVSTLKLPKTTFPPRGASPADQALYLKKCTDDLYAWQRQNRSDQIPFILHDGPPYANGDLHIGHALNKILKDITNRYQLLKGRRVDYVPGWDCHGLPIELRALELWRQSQPENVGNETPPAIEVREKARALATETVERQKKQFREWGIMADWDNAWKTMDPRFEIRQLEVFGKMVRKGLIYRRYKPVYWSPSTRTALAEAELEYRDDHVSRAAFVKYPLHAPSIHKGLMEKLGGQPADISVLIWTTLPWTLPANRGIGFNPSIEYVVARSRKHGRMLLARSRKQEVEEKCEETLTEVAVFQGSELCDVCYEDPLWSNQVQVRTLLEADHVTGDSGSGLAHLAPGHGPDDYRICLSRKINPYSPVDERGCFTTDACPKDSGLLAGKSVFTDGNLAVLKNLESSDALLAAHDYTHKYPYDWRSKAPIIIRATRQWFANVAGIQNSALESLGNVSFTPASGKSRLESFVCNRNEWCISRQRAWGVPIPALYHTKTNEPILTGDSVDYISSVIAERGMDSWWTDDEFDPTWTPPTLRESSGQTVYYRGKDTIDVWFDSGTSWTQLQSGNDGRPVVADVYLEGSDQHRGWFQSSLLTATACQDGATHEDGKILAPFKHLVTHGFTLDKAGTKMSKSVGNVISPQQIMDGSLLPILTKKGKDGAQRKIQDSMGTDALRLWVASCDYTKDVVVSPEALKKINNVLAKYRTTFKQLIGLLNGHDPSTGPRRLEHLSTNHKIALIQLSSIEETVVAHYERMEYHKAISALNKYVSNDLSAFYFESIKDAAYCGTSEQRAAVQSTAHEILGVLQDVLAPITPLLIQEIQHHLPEMLRSTPHISRLSRQIQMRPAKEGPSRPDDLSQVKLDLPALIDLLKSVQSLQEQARSDKKMGSSLQSYIAIIPRDMAGSSKVRELMLKYANDLNDIFCASAIELVSPAFKPPSEVGWQYVQEIETLGEKVTVYVFAPQQRKCVRCWRYKAPLKAEEALCDRCVDVLQDLKKDQPELFEEGATDTGDVLKVFLFLIISLKRSEEISVCNCPDSSPLGDDRSHPLWAWRGFSRVSKQTNIASPQRTMDFLYAQNANPNSHSHELRGQLEKLRLSCQIHVAVIDDLKRVNLAQQTNIQYKDQELQLYYKHFNKLIHHLNHTNIVLTQTQLELVESGHTTNETLRLMEHYKRQCEMLTEQLKHSENQKAEQERVMKAMYEVMEKAKGFIDAPSPKQQRSNSTGPLTTPMSKPNYYDTTPADFNAKRGPISATRGGQEVNSAFDRFLHRQQASIATAPFPAPAPGNKHGVSTRSGSRSGFKEGPISATRGGHDVDSAFGRFMQQLGQSEATTGTGSQTSTPGTARLNPASAPFTPSATASQRHQDILPPAQPIFVRPAKKSVRVAPSVPTPELSETQPVEARRAATTFGSSVASVVTESQNVPGTTGTVQSFPRHEGRAPKNAVPDEPRVKGTPAPKTVTEPGPPQKQDAAADALRAWFDQLKKENSATPSAKQSPADRGHLIEFSNPNSPESVIGGTKKDAVIEQKARKDISSVASRRDVFSQMPPDVRDAIQRIQKMASTPKAFQEIREPAPLIPYASSEDSFDTHDSSKVSSSDNESHDSVRDPFSGSRLGKEEGTLSEASSKTLRPPTATGLTSRSASSGQPELTSTAVKFQTLMSQDPKAFVQQSASQFSSFPSKWKFEPSNDGSRAQVTHRESKGEGSEQSDAFHSAMEPGKGLFAFGSRSTDTSTPKSGSDTVYASETKLREYENSRSIGGSHVLGRYLEPEVKVMVLRGRETNIETPTDPLTAVQLKYMGVDRLGNKWQKVDQIGDDGRQKSGWVISHFYDPATFDPYGEAWDGHTSPS